MTKILVGALAVFAMSLMPNTKAGSAESTLGTSGQSSASQLMLTALAEPGSPQPGQTFKLMEDLHLSFGLKIWFNTWEDSKFGENLPSPHIIKDSSSGVGYIPTFGLRYKDFFLSASGMFATAYKFDAPPSLTSITGARSFGASRQEADINLGYYLHPMLAVSVGYKGIYQTLHVPKQVVGTDPFSCGAPQPSQYNFDYNGLTVGLAANVPLGKGGLDLLPWGLTIYGNAGGGYMFEHAFKCVSLGNHAAYGVGELGLAYKPGELPLVFTVGYKYQLLNTQLNSTFKSFFNKNSVDDVTRGPLIGLILVF
jgi:hypothetical protein